jgi:WD40 repeat protein
MSYGASGFVYVANQTDSTVSQYSYSTSGALTPLNPPTVAAGGLPSDIAVGAFQGATNNFILVANTNDNTISYYNVNPDGTLAIKSTLPSGGTGPTRLLTTNTSVFVMNGINNMMCPFTYKAGTIAQGAPFSVPGVSDIAYNSDADASELFAVAAGNSNSLSRLQDYAPITSTQSVPLPTAPLSVAVDPGIVTNATQNGIYVASNAGFIDQYTQDPTTLKITLQSNAPVAVPSKSIVLRASQFPISAIQHRLYAVFSDANLVRVYGTDNVGLNTTTSTATSTGNYPSDIAFAVVTVTTGGVQTTVKSAHKARQETIQ